MNIYYSNFKKLLNFALVTAAALLIFTGGNSAIFAADGDLDASFDGDGKVITGNFFNEGGRDTVIQPDGKIITVGAKTSNFNSANMAAVRYLANGSLDTGFGTNGIFVLPLTAPEYSSASGIAVELQPDGKILLAGYGRTLTSINAIFLLVRLNANGTLDTTFGSGGRTFYDLGSLNAYGGLASMVFDAAQNKIYLGGTIAIDYNNSIYGYGVVRFNGNGSLDTTFNGTGAQTFRLGDSGGLFTALTDIALQSDGKIIATGGIQYIAAGGESIESFGTARINVNGTLDSSFGTGGIVITNYPGSNLFYSAVARTVSILPNGKIFIGGTGGTGSGGTIRNFYFAAQLNTDGSPDSSFGTGGKIRAEAIMIVDSVITPSGKIIVIGEKNANFGVARLNPNGSLDSTFGTGGFVQTGFGTGSTEYPAAVALQQDGKIVVSGGAKNPNTSGPGSDYTLIARYGDSPANAFINFTGLQNNEYPREFYNGGAGSLGSTGGTNYNVSFVINGNGFEGGIVETAFTSPQIRNDSRRITLNVPRGFTRVSFKYSRPAAGSTLVCFARSLSAISLGGTELGRTNLPETTAAAGFDTAAQPVTTFQFSGTARSLEFSCGGGQLAIDDIALTVSSLPVNNPVLKIADFDGDGKADLSVFRPSNAVWYQMNSASGFAAQSWGAATDKLTPADYDGDGKTDLAVWREDTNNPDFSYFYIWQSATGTLRIAQFGRIGDNPNLSADWDGDGKADPTVYRDGANAGGGQSYFYYQPSAQPSVKFVAVSWGAAGDLPVRGDFDGDKKMDAAVFRPSNGFWYILQS